MNGISLFTKASILRKSITWVYIFGFTTSSLSWAGDYISVVEVGNKFFSGDTTPSLTGSSGYSVDLRAEQKKGFFRPSVAEQLEFASGTVRFSDTDTPSFTMFSGTFLGGINIFPFKEARISPFVGASGVLSLNRLSLSGQAADVEANTQGLGFGYEISGGCDVSGSSSGETAFRVRASYVQNNSTLAGSSLILSGWKISMGYKF